MVYFSSLEAPGTVIDAGQDKGVEKFRSRIFDMGLASSFGSRRQFEESFRKQLGLAVHQILAEFEKEKPKRVGAEQAKIIQNGNHNLQSGYFKRNG